MAYYLKSVDFLDPQSIAKSNITDLVKAYKFFCRLWNDFIPTYGNYRRCAFITDWNQYRNETPYQLKTMINDSIEMSILLKDYLETWEEIDFQKHVQVIEKYKNVEIDEEIFDKKIQYCRVSTQLENFISSLSGISIWHPDQKSTPIWVEGFTFPNHGGDEESYYIQSGWFSEYIYTESSYNIKFKWIICNIDNQVFRITIGRLAHL